MKLKGQVAFVTGASRGLGQSIARTLAAEGARIACVARPSAHLDSTLAALDAAGATAIACPADVTREAEVESAMRATLERFGQIDIVVINAGAWRPGTIIETSEALWDQLIDLNLKAAFLTLKHTLPPMIERRQGTVIGIGSFGGWVGQPGSSAYGASKWGLRGLFESVALEVKTHRIRVSLVHPHNMNSEHKPIAADAPERRTHLETEDVASLIAFICSAPDYVAFGNVTIWPQAAGIAGRMT